MNGEHIVPPPTMLSQGELSEEQREQRRKIGILKLWEIKIQPLDRGCVVYVGCKSFAFVSIEAAYKEIGRYLENPQLVATQYGFEEHL